MVASGRSQHLLSTEPRRRLVSVVALVALAAPGALLVSASTASAATETYTTVFTAAQEVPSNASAGMGTATATLDTVTNDVTVNGTFSGLGSNATMAHIHGPGAPGVNAAIQVTLTVPNATSGAVTGNGTLTAAQVNQLRTGLLYINIHTVNFGGGEIRGQLGVPSAPRGVAGGTGGKSSQASVSFVAPAGDGGAAVASYEARCMASGRPTRMATKTTSPITVLNLVNGVSYACTVRARNSRGFGPPSRAASVRAGVPSAPLSTSAAKGSALGSIKVSWSAAITPSGAPITGFGVSCVSGASSKGANASASARNMTIGGLNRALMYICKVVARNKFGSGPARAAAAIKPR